MLPSNLKPPLLVLLLWLQPSSIPLQRLNLYSAPSSPLRLCCCPAGPVLSLKAPESNAFLCLWTRDVVAVYRGRFVPQCPGTAPGSDGEIWVGGRGRLERGEEMEGRVHDKEPFHRCNWYLSFFRKCFWLSEVQQMSQGSACLRGFAQTLAHGLIILLLCSFHFEEAALFSPTFDTC